jgi:hypothetical protein
MPIGDHFPTMRIETKARFLRAGIESPWLVYLVPPQWLWSHSHYGGLQLRHVGSKVCLRRRHAMTDHWSHEETSDPLQADRRNFR